MDKIEKLLKEEAAAREAFTAAQKKLQGIVNRRRKAQLALEAKETLTLALALETYVPSGENIRGFNYLDQLSFKGAWRDTGLGKGLGYWNKTNQWMLTLRVNHQWDDAKMAELEKLVLEVIELVRPGSHEKTLKLTSKGSSVDASTLRVLDISNNGLSRYNDWCLGRLEDGSWAIFDSRELGRSWGRARLTGTLRECLEEIREFLWSEGGPVSDDEEDFD